MFFDLRNYKDDIDQKTIRSVMDEAKKNPDSTIILPPKTYLLTSDIARKTMKDVISGKYGENPEPTIFRADFPYTIGLDFSGHIGTTFEAYGSIFMVDGFMEPIAVRNSKNITLKGFAIDHIRKPYSKGIIEKYEVSDSKARSGYILVRFGDSYPVDEHTIMPRYCVYDYHTHRFQLDMWMTKREYLGNQLFCFHMIRMPEDSLVGQEFYIWHSYHSRPAILLDESINTTLKDVTIHSQPGMGIVAHHCDDILLERLHVIPSHNENMSTNTDATHFVSCKGNLIFRDCEFQGHGDDAVNIHTFYHDVTILKDNRIQGRVTVPTHSLKIDYPDIGDEMQFVDKCTLEPKGNRKIRKLEKTKDYYIAALDSPLPKDAEKDCYLANLTRSPNVLFNNCTFKNHWARSILLKCRNVKIQNCFFNGSVIQAIHIAPEAAWHEGIACENIIIENNRFIDCGITGHSAVGGIKIEVSAPNPKGQLQKHFKIENNCFDLPHTEYAISISNAEDVILKGNRYLNCKNHITLNDCTLINNEDDKNDK